MFAKLMGHGDNIVGTAMKEHPPRAQKMPRRPIFGRRGVERAKGKR